MYPSPLDDFNFHPSSIKEKPSKNKASSLRKSKSTKNLQNTKRKRDEFHYEIRKEQQNDFVLTKRLEKTEIEEALIKYAEIDKAIKNKQEV